MRKILVADSANVTQFVLERILGQNDFQVLYVKYARDLVVQVKEIMPDLIFLEPEISGGKGQKIVEFLSRQPETMHIPIILITRIADTKKHLMDQWPNVRGVIRKPLKSARIKELIERVEIPNTADLSRLLGRTETG